MDTWFPNEIEHAASLLDAVDNDLEAARSLARQNAIDAPTFDGFLYWAKIARTYPVTQLDVLIAECGRTPEREWN